MNLSAIHESKSLIILWTVALIVAASTDTSPRSSARIHGQFLQHTHQQALHTKSRCTAPTANGSCGAWSILWCHSCDCPTPELRGACAPSMDLEQQPQSAHSHSGAAAKRSLDLGFLWGQWLWSFMPKLGDNCWIGGYITVKWWEACGSVLRRVPCVEAGISPGVCVQTCSAVLASGSGAHRVVLSVETWGLSDSQPSYLTLKLLYYLPVHLCFRDASHETAKQRSSGNMSAARSAAGARASERFVHLRSWRQCRQSTHARRGLRAGSAVRRTSPIPSKDSLAAVQAV